MGTVGSRIVAMASAGAGALAMLGVATAQPSSPAPPPPTSTAAAAPFPMTPPPSRASWASVPIHGYSSPPASSDGVTVRNTGIVLFVTMYGLTAIGSGVAYGTGVAGEAPGDPACTESTPWGFLPLVGPFILAGNYPDYQKLDAQGGTAACADYTTAVAAVSVIDGLVQIGGVALLIAGLGMGGQATDDTSSISIGVHTMSLPGGAGLALDGSF